MAAFFARLFHRHGGSKDFVEAAVCKASDIAENGMKLCELGDKGRVLVVKHEGKISALGTKCSHYGAPLEKGVLANGRVRCPWHGACFNVDTGDIEDFPGLDGIPCYQVTVKADDSVVVRAKKEHLIDNKCTRPLAGRNKRCTDTVLVLGGGGAGASCVESLRKSGFDGRIVLTTKEKHLPYDRPKLSKALDVTPEKIQLRSAEFYKAADIEVLLDHEAVEVDAVGKKVRFRSGAQLQYTRLVVATGSTPRRMSTAGSDLDGVCVLRAPEDGARLVDRLDSAHVVVVGASFIGMEVAAYCVGKASSVTVVATASVPYANVLGEKIGSMLKNFFESKGVVFKLDSGVKEFKGEDNSLSKVVLTDGTELSATACVLGIGVTPNTDFLKGVVSMDDRGHVEVDQHLQTSVEGVFAAGDVASVPLPLLGGARLAVGHWQLAHYLGKVAGEAAAGLDSSVDTVPFFWTQLFGKSIRYAGHCKSFDEVVYDGSVEEQKFAAFFCSAGQVQAVATMNRDPEAARWAEHMAAHGFPSKEEVQQALDQNKQ